MQTTPTTSPWLIERRRLALETSAATPLPKRGLALWRYTDPATFDQPLSAPKATAVDQNVIAELKAQLADGKLSALVIETTDSPLEVHLSPAAQNGGVQISELAAAIASSQSSIEPYLYQLVNDQFGKFESANGAHWERGIYLAVPDKLALSAPIHLIRVAPSSGTAHPRLLGVIGKQAEVTIVDEYIGGSSNEDAPSLSNGAVELFGLDDSKTQYVALQRTSVGTNSYLTHRARIGANANMMTVPLVFGGKIAKQNFGVLLAGSGAESNMIGVLFGTDYQHFDNHTLHHHVVGQTRSNIDFKVVLKDKALSAYTGLIRIDKNAKVCEAYQENRNLLLTRGTKAETIPELEILNEDVSCTHGATVGPIDPLQVFYLNCRGIDKTEATRMIVAGYVESTFGLLPDQLRERISDYVEQRLASL